MCHWLGVVQWKTLSDRNFWFICVHTHKKTQAILAPIISLRSFIVLILFLEVLMLTGDWKSCASGRRLSSASAWSLVQSGCWCTHSGLGDGAGGPASLARCQSSRWEKQFTEAVEWEKCKTQLNLSGWPLFYLPIYFSLLSRGVNLQINHKDARDGQAWVNGAAFQLTASLCLKP